MAILIKSRFWMLRNGLTRLSGADWAKTGAFGLFGFFVLAVLYFGFYRLLTEVKNVQLIGGILSLKLMAMTFLTTFSMIVFSSALASFTTLFFSKDLNILIQSPLPFRTVFIYKSVETSFFASWMVLMTIIPFMAAFGRVYDLGAGFYLLLTVLSAPFVAIACVLGIGASLGLMCVFPSKKVREVMLLLGVLAGGGVYVVLRWMSPDKFVKADAFDKVVQYVQVLEAPTAPYLPSWWITRAAAAYMAGRRTDVALQAGWLYGTAALLWTGMMFFAHRSYYGGWTSAQESGRRRKPIPLGSEWRWAPGVFGKRFKVLLGKDILVFFRDSNQWSQLLMLFSIVAIYLISIRKLPLDTPYLKGLVSFLNIGMVGFVMASVSLRFVFPLVSLEGKSWWCLRTAPMGLWGILWGKFFLGFGPLAGTGLILVWASNWFLNVDPFVARLSNVTVVLMGFTLTGMGVGFGALFPRFRVENVAQIQTSAGGILYMATSLFYVAMTMSFEALLMRRHYWAVLSRSGDGWMETILLAGTGLFTINAAAFILPFVFGKRRLETLDV